MIPSGTDAGDVLLANSINAVLLDTAGDIIDTYTLPGNGGGDFSLNLDPNGTDFWNGGDFATGTMWEVNIATGAIDNSFLTCGSGCLYGVSVFGERTVVNTPEPASLALIGSGLIGSALSAGANPPELSSRTTCLTKALSRTPDKAFALMQRGETEQAERLSTDRHFPSSLHMPRLFFILAFSARSKVI